MIGTAFPYIEYLPKPGQARGVQFDIKPERIGLRYPVEVGLVGDASQTLSELLPLLQTKNSDSIQASFLKSKQEAMKKWNDLLASQSNLNKNSIGILNNSKKNDEGSNKGNKNLIKPQAIASAVSKYLDDNAIVSVDSGTNTIFAARFIKMRKGMKFSLSGTLASMACGLPYSIAAKIAFPERQSVAFVGDGGFTMLMGEFATAVQYNLPIKLIILKNNTLGMIRWEQMAFLGNPEFGVEFSSIDFTKFAEACGGRGYTIRYENEIEEVMSIAMKGENNNKPVLIEAYVDPFEPPMPPKVEPEFVKNIAESFAKGQPYTKRIGLTLFRNQIDTTAKDVKSKVSQTVDTIKKTINANDQHQ
jgi:pyruvate dehydrogenase (quinone)/pyruvate oxidase